MTKPTLSYYAVRGYAETIRIILAEANVDYNKNYFKMGGVSEEHAKLKNAGVLDFGQVPLWEEENLKLVQSAAISRYLGRKYGLYGDNEIEAAKIDSTVEGVRDTLQAIIKIASAPEDKKVQVWNDIKTKDIPKWLGFFETILKNNGNGCLVGTKVSIADLYLASLVEELIDVEVSIESFSLVKAHFATIYSRPNIAHYVKDPSRFSSTLVNFVPK